ncbi:carbohydrate ABC transporter permease [Actinospica sp.]|jgi:multiple sugar transport system permease protein|uniref:carbohydrate ABC transporter permease n=1 Tax=Actinospica sp. TaxID=1872142 RepID=UPI002BA12240|nr:carbohydrate ABC transporter permease [Actinospica sp.]HWG27539.1 carbohydrate ABC transporter permease [Actinospica sp.]
MISSKRLRTIGFHTGASALSLLWFLPIALILIISFRSTDDVLGNGLNALPHSFAPGNYSSAWSGGGMQQALINSAIVAVPAVLLTLLLGSMAAFALSRYRIPFRRTLILLMLGGNLLPPQILLVPVAKLSQVFGLYDSLATLIVVEIGFGLGFYVFVLQGFMRTIPAEIQQAALIDGAGAWQIYFRIVLPLTRPALAALGALAFTWIFNDLLWPITVLITQSKMPVTPALLSLQGQFVSYWNVIAAGSVIAAIPTVAVFLRFQKHFIAGLNLGAVK